VIKVPVNHAFRDIFKVNEAKIAQQALFYAVYFK
jgi:hypothetical protein